MAEIRVEPKRRSLAWLWIIIVLLVIAALAYYFLYYRGGQGSTTRTTSMTSVTSITPPPLLRPALGARAGAHQPHWT